MDSHGRVVWLEASYNPVLDSNERLYKVVKFATVITDQVNQEQAVAEAANIAYSTSLQTDSSAQRGTTVVTQAVEVMRDLAQHMQHAGEGIEALNAQSQVIGTIVKTIQNQDMARDAVSLMNSGKSQAEEGLALAAEAGTVIVEIQDGAQRVVNAVGQFANQLST